MYFNSSGNVINLGREIGRGGEGIVYDTPSLDSNFVVKIYHAPIHKSKQEKLVLMASICSEQLSKISTWPSDTIHVKDGSVVGFVMQKLEKHEPIHKLYSPTHRKQVFPKANWAFLINTAKNLSAAFHTIHSSRHIIGDINQGNIYVSHDSTIKLIDCDSFQISSTNRIFRCEVGVSHFTPPEMQSLKSYDGFDRTPSQDNFALAIVCFHLIFMGRHPFSGVPCGKESITIEKAIQNYMFAFGKNSYSKGIKPPPNCITMDVVPQYMVNLFEEAFSENNNRPLASEWNRALGNFKNELVSCGHEPIHVYYKGLPFCPWCTLEKQSGVLFFINPLENDSQISSFNINEIWNKITGIQSPGPAPTINIDKIKATPTPLPMAVVVARMKSFCIKIAGVALFLISFFVAIGIGNFLPVIIGFFISVAVYNSCQNDSSEKAKRRNELLRAESRWKNAEQAWIKEAGDYKFKEKFKNLCSLKSQYENLPEEYSKKRQELNSTIKQRQLNKFLSSFYIDDYKINNIGESRKATLSSFGVETAADIEARKILSINGFGESLTSDLLVWRKVIENQFVFDSSKGIDPNDIKLLNHEFQRKKIELECKIRSGIELLLKTRNDAINNRDLLESNLEEAARAFVQARKDWSSFK